MKRIVSFMLALMLIFTVTVTETHAMGLKVKFLPPGLAKKGKLPPGIAKKFKDIDKYDWAEKAIEKMAIKGVVKGYGEGEFAPEKSVTKLEAIIMALRVMGYEDEAKMNLKEILEGEKEFDVKGLIDEWAYGYVDVAEEKGILDEVDLLDLNLRNPAKRHEVAKYIIRALGYEEEAKEYSAEDLDFIDTPAIPLGAVGYIYLANEKGIITGYPDNTFRPNRIVTRAEMAVMVARLDDKVDSEIDENEEYAEVKYIDEDVLKLEGEDGVKEYDLAKNVPVYNEDGKYVSIDDINEGMKVKVQLNDEGTIIFIEIKDSENIELISEYEGIVKEVEEDNITIKTEDNITMTFELDNDVEVIFEDEEEGQIDDIREEDEVEIKVNDDNEVKYIEVDRELEKDEYDYEGTVIENVYEDEEITIEVDNIRMTFEVSDDVGVEFKDEDGDIEDIEEDDYVKIKLDDEEVEYIKVDRELEEDLLSGEIVSIDEDSNQMVIKNDTEYKIYNIDTDVIVEINDEIYDLEDLEAGDEVEFKVEDDKVTKIISTKIVVND